MKRRTLIGCSSAAMISVTGCLGWFEDEEPESDDDTPEQDTEEPTDTETTDEEPTDDSTETPEEGDSIMDIVEVEEDANFDIEPVYVNRLESELRCEIRVENITERTFEDVAIQLELHNDVGRHFDTITSSEDTIQPGETHSMATIERGLQTDIWDDLDMIVVSLRYFDEDSNDMDDTDDGQT